MVRTRKRTAGAVTGAVTAALVLALGGCGGDGGGGDGGESSPTAEQTQTGTGSPSPGTTGSPSPTASPSPTGTAGGASQVSLRSTGEVGKILVGPDGRTLYLFDADTAKKSTCYDACAKAWPPLTVSGEPTARKGVDAGMLGTTKRKDGSKQVTYNGHPLYYYEPDDEPGDVAGQGLNHFGAKWWVVDASGNKVVDQAGDGQKKQEQQEEQDPGVGGY